VSATENKVYKIVDTAFAQGLFKFERSFVYLWLVFQVGVIFAGKIRQSLHLMLSHCIVCLLASSVSVRLT
jgi:hypothetical protein